VTVPRSSCTVMLPMSSVSMSHTTSSLSAKFSHCCNNFSAAELFTTRFASARAARASLLMFADLACRGQGFATCARQPPSRRLCLLLAVLRLIGPQTRRWYRCQLKQSNPQHRMQKMTTLTKPLSSQCCVALCAVASPTPMFTAMVDALRRSFRYFKLVHDLAKQHACVSLSNELLLLSDREKHMFGWSMLGLGLVRQPVNTTLGSSSSFRGRG